MDITSHFTLAEMTRTNHRSLAEANRTNAEAHLQPLTLVCTMLERIRAHFGRAVIIHSGYRSSALNAEIGGSRTSQHVKGEAADFHVSGVDLREVFDWIRNESGLEWGQLILEGNVKGMPSWIHMSLGHPWRPLAKSQQVLVMDAGKWTRL